MSKFVKDKIINIAEIKAALRCEFPYLFQFDCKVLAYAAVSNFICELTHIQHWRANANLYIDNLAELQKCKHDFVNYLFNENVEEEEDKFGDWFSDDFGDTSILY